MKSYGTIVSDLYDHERLNFSRIDGKFKNLVHNLQHRLRTGLARVIIVSSDIGFKEPTYIKQSNLCIMAVCKLPFQRLQYLLLKLMITHTSELKGTKMTSKDQALYMKS